MAGQFVWLVLVLCSSRVCTHSFGCLCISDKWHVQHDSAILLLGCLAPLGTLPPPSSLSSVSLLTSSTMGNVSWYSMSSAQQSLPSPGVAGGSSHQQMLASAVAGPVTSTSWTSHHPVSSPWATGVSSGAAWASSGPVSQFLPAAGLALSPGSEPFPQRLVDKIRSGQFMDMRDLLSDNIALLDRLDVLGGQPSLALPGALKPRLREVSSLPTWIYCFLAYVAIRAPDLQTQHMLAYARLVIREAQRHGGTAWLDYDRVFRQQTARCSGTAYIQVSRQPLFLDVRQVQDLSVHCAEV